MNIYVGNLSYQSSEDQLRELFGAHGEVNSVSIIKDRETGRSKGFAFVEMANDNEGHQAIEALNGMSFVGRNISVNEARPREERPRRDFRGGGGGDRRFNRRDDY